MQQQVFGGQQQSARVVRPLWPALKRGFFCRCPNCGEGKLFRAFTKTFDNCQVCGEEFHHHRAVVLGGFMGVEATSTLTTWQHLAIWAPLTVIMSLALLQPIKGAVVGLQWAYYMHGFGGEVDHIEGHPET